MMTLRGSESVVRKAIVGYYGTYCFLAGGATSPPEIVESIQAKNTYCTVLTTGSTRSTYGTEERRGRMEARRHQARKRN
jgi:hypothetical protein